ncbi:NAC domain-containing protein 40 [Cucumis melo var. makuwa]|uniref:NAC domain-containing protein 40 n=1 Tax=Cucumis melo var. makuwa TaxID=1194695 RepID=A0A5D3B874_CUCMM|nr:NAC domain-containing protein 40 [Cucumis melo var. makuwa]
MLVPDGMISYSNSKACQLILLSQERNIQRLNEVVRSLRQQLQQCRGRNITNGTALLTGHILELERLHVLED